MQRVTTNNKTGKSRERDSHLCVFSVLCNKVGKFSLRTAVIAVAVLVLKFIKITTIIVIIITRVTTILRQCHLRTIKPSSIKNVWNFYSSSKTPILLLKEYGSYNVVRC
jgi:hypothetical protein